MAILVPMLGVISSICLVVGISLFRQKSDVENELTGLTQSQKTSKLSYFEIRIRPTGRRLARMIPSLRKVITPSDISDRLIYAGSPLGLDGALFYGVQLLAGLVAAVFGLLLGTIVARVQGGLIGMLLLGTAGLAYPIIWLDDKVQKRQFEISLGVPDSLDLLSTSMEAGLGFDQALQHVVGRIKGPLSEELERVLRELQMGIPRQECFRHIYARNSAKELRSFIGAVIQAHELGAPISKTLQDQAEEMRIRRIQKAREAGAQASPKISLVTTILIAPAVMCMFVAVLGFHLAQTVGPLLQEFGR